MRKHGNKATKDNYSFGLFVRQVAKDGEVPYTAHEEDEDFDPEQIKHTDKELRTLLDYLPEDTPEGFRAVITEMTKYAPEERAALVTVKETMGFDAIGDKR